MVTHLAVGVGLDDELEGALGGGVGGGGVGAHDTLPALGHEGGTEAARGTKTGHMASGGELELIFVCVVRELIALNKLEGAPVIVAQGDRCRCKRARRVVTSVHHTHATGHANTDGKAGEDRLAVAEEKLAEHWLL